MRFESSDPGPNSAVSRDFPLLSSNFGKLTLRGYRVDNDLITAIIEWLPETGLFSFPMSVQLKKITAIIYPGVDSPELR
ncbi:hypothetical protein J2848_005799 [Azospirillum lipoferum]|uniref:Uncharacterized protein n=1 Tax=Azospirillum lipoferum TaxID=193 RepID=A0A5A9GHM2_AZOLI|nr:MULTISPECIES: hypothetical protein [Azospirillum]KAA0593837.1 hypothetical protein FZ942_23460 [Azospirillum lipoferum]MCP1614096.1 hypothetical protein [Azospirillum lipoferum]MDW5536785.1 hypothetical protein [Azospirillum sp. NL1]